MKLNKIMVFLAIIISLYGYNPQRLEADKPVITLDQHLTMIFGTKATIAKAVLKHESGLKLDSINYNCIYNGKSTFCKKGDESKAWSVDCGIAQVNVRGKVCPTEFFTLEGNMKQVEKIYKEQGLQAWVSYKTGAYKKFL